MKKANNLQKKRNQTDITFQEKTLHIYKNKVNFLDN